jgi:4'-phosphopantetheinyl transferase
MHAAIRDRVVLLELDLPPNLMVTRVSLGSLAPPAEIESWLSSTEQAKAATFKFHHLSHRYVWGRAALRAVLGGVLGRAPDALVIDTTSLGRPFLRGVSNFDFNVSHAGEVALIAIWKGPGVVGVDIEKVDPRMGVMSDVQLSLEELVCTPTERTKLPVEQMARAEAFFCLWTCKEACLKAIGTGLLTDPREFDIDITAEGQPLLRASPRSSRFAISTFPVRPGYLGAVAIAS